MLIATYPVQVLLLTFSGLVNRHQAGVIAYHAERAHQGLRNEGIDGTPSEVAGEVLRRERLGAAVVLRAGSLIHVTGTEKHGVECPGLPVGTSRGDVGRDSEPTRTESAGVRPSYTSAGFPDPTGTGVVECTERLGGILKHYRRAA